MSKFQYTHFGDEVPREVEKEYNRMGQREHYLEEQDAAHDVMYLDHKDISRIPDYPADELSPADLLRWYQGRRNSLCPFAVCRLWY